MIWVALAKRLDGHFPNFVVDAAASVVNLVNADRVNGSANS
jgi:hypothetical protein